MWIWRAKESDGLSDSFVQFHHATDSQCPYIAARPDCMRHVVTPAQACDYEEIAALNVAAYREFAGHMSPDDWLGMEANMCAVEIRAQTTRFFVVRDKGMMVGSAGYSPAGKGDLHIFPRE